MTATEIKEYYDKWPTVMCSNEKCEANEPTGVFKSQAGSFCPWCAVRTPDGHNQPQGMLNIVLPEDLHPETFANDLSH